MSPARKISGANQRHAQFAGWPSSRSESPLYAAAQIRRYAPVVRCSILQKNCQTVRCRIHDGGVCLGTVLQWKAMRYQRIKLHIPAADQPQKFLHVAVFRPAHISERVIAPLLLVSGIITPRPVSARHIELNFLQVHVVPRETHLDCADHHDASTIAADVERQFAWRRRFRSRRDDHAIRALAVRNRRDLLPERAARENRLLRA